MDLALTSHIEDRLQGKQTSYGKKNKTKKQTEIASMEGNDFDQFNIQNDERLIDPNQASDYYYDVDA